MRTLLLLALPLALGAGCKKDPPASQPAAAAASADHNWSSLKMTMTVTAVIVAKDIADACGMSDADRLFPYDVAAPRSGGQQNLKMLSDCLKSNQRLKVRIIGHDDPRGDDAFRSQQGRSRAEALGKVLETKGVAAMRFTTESLGPRFASPDGPSGWPVDRQVDIIKE